MAFEFITNFHPKRETESRSANQRRVSSDKRASFHWSKLHGRFIPRQMGRIGWNRR